MLPNPFGVTHFIANLDIFDAIVTLVFSSYASPIAIHEENFSKLNTVFAKKNA